MDSVTSTIEPNEPKETIELWVPLLFWFPPMFVYRPIEKNDNEN